MGSGLTGKQFFNLSLNMIASVKGGKMKIPFPLKVYPFTLTHKDPNKNCSRRYFIFYLYLSKKIRLDFSCDSLETSSLIFSDKQ